MAASVTDHSDCITEFIEIVPLERDREFIYPVIEVKAEEVQDVKVEPADKNDSNDYSDVSEVSCCLETAENDIRIPLAVTGCDMRPVDVLEKSDLSRVKCEYFAPVNTGPYYCNIVKTNDDRPQMFAVNSRIPIQTPGSTTQPLDMCDHVRVDTGKQMQAEDDKQCHAGPDSAPVSAVASTRQSLTEGACATLFTDSCKYKSQLCVRTQGSPVRYETGDNRRTELSSINVICVITGEQPFECQVCFKRFIYKHELLTHMRIHTRECPYECGVCSKKFRWSANLTQHMLIHTGERRFECQACGNKFKESGHLTQHMRIHSADRPYECQICGVRCKSSSHLTSHLWVHSADRPFECGVCGKKFTISRHLARHMRRFHAGERSFECQYCSKKCTASGDVSKQLGIQTGENPIHCEVCGK